MKVAILVFPGAEELDFVGFMEALSMANRVQGERYFETELVGTRTGPIVCSGGLKVVPDENLRDLRGHDLLLVPGGEGADALHGDRFVLDALKKTYQEGKMVWSVCTGALLLAAAGLLDGRAATTHHQFLDYLKRSGARVRSARVVVDGRITTGGGVSSSIDVGLELVKNTLGPETAREVGEWLEYPPALAGARESGKADDMVKCPVCGMLVNGKKTKLVSEYNGKKFYFCSPACRAAFDKDPDKFLSKL